ncbi:MAG: DUF86 domain-containing protein [Bacteroidetes bacterium]|nr:DUF86 domain-containing protein [Bacteroidota bacterium]
MKDRNKERLLYILEAINSIYKFCENQGKKDFIINDLLVSAVLQKFLIIGKAVSNLDSYITNKYEFPWHKPRAFRNFIAHEYFHIKAERIWETIISDLPVIEDEIRNILIEEFGFVQ